MNQGWSPFKIDPVSSFLGSQDQDPQRKKVGLVWDPAKGTFVPGDPAGYRGIDSTTGLPLDKEGFTSEDRSAIDAWRRTPHITKGGFEDGQDASTYDLPPGVFSKNKRPGRPFQASPMIGAKMPQMGSYRGNSFNVGSGGRNRPVFG